MPNSAKNTLALANLLAGYYLVHDKAGSLVTRLPPGAQKPDAVRLSWTEGDEEVWTSFDRSAEVEIIGGDKISIRDTEGEEFTFRALAQANLDAVVKTPREDAGSETRMGSEFEQLMNRWQQDADASATTEFGQGYRVARELSVSELIATLAATAATPDAKICAEAVATTTCPHCSAPCREEVLIRGGDNGWGDDKSRTVRRYAAPAAGVVATEERIEAGARAMALNDGWHGWDSAIGCNDTLSGNTPEEERTQYRDLAKVCLAATSHSPPVGGSDG